MRKLAVLLSWKNQAEYYMQELARVISNQYETTISYHELDFTGFDVVFTYFASSNPVGVDDKLVKRFAAFHEVGGCKWGKVNVVSCTLMLERMLQHGSEVLLTPLGVNPEHFYPRPFPQTPKLRVGWAGPPTWPKRLEKLEALLETLPGVEFVPAIWRGTAGIYKGPYETKDMGQYYAGIHVYVCSSSSEGFCCPILEASACGRPVVTFDVGVARDLKAVGAGITIIEDKDDFRALGEAISSIDYQKLGGQSAEAVREHWLWEKVKFKWLEAFARIK